MSEFPNPPNQDDLRVELRRRTILISAASHGSRTQPSLSLDGIVVSQSIGTTDWLVSPPSQSSKYQPFPLFHPLRLQSQLDFTFADGDSHHLLKTTDLSEEDHQEISQTSNANASSSTSSTHEESHSSITEIDVLYTRLRPGQMLYIPPLWTYQTLATSTSVAIVVPTGRDPLKLKLDAIARHPNVKSIASKASEQEDPQQDLDFRIHSLLRILAPIPRLMWYPNTMQSYEAFHSRLVMGKMNIAQQMVRQSCLARGGLVIDRPPLPAAPSQEIRELESELTALILGMEKSFEKQESQVISVSLAAESVLFGFLQDPQLTHSFLHECEHYWND